MYVCVKYNFHFFIMPSLKTAVSDGLGSFQQDRSVDRDGECTTLASETNGKKTHKFYGIMIMFPLFSCLMFTINSKYTDIPFFDIQISYC